LPGVSAAPPPIKLGAGETPYVPAPPQLTYPGGAGMAGQPGQPGQPAYPRTQPGPIQASPLGAPARAPIAQPSPLPPPPGAAPPGGQPTAGGTLPLGPPMTPRELATERTAGETAGPVRANLPNTLQATRETINTIDELLADDKGLEGSTGKVVGRLPFGLNQTTTNWINKLGQLQGQTFRNVLSQLQRSGALRGEGAAQKLQAAVADLERTNDPDAMRKNLKALRDSINNNALNAIQIAGSTPEKEKWSPGEAPTPQARLVQGQGGIPVRPPNLPMGSQISSDRTRWRHPNGTIYDLNGQPVK
jgi:hypothetical protein